MSSPTPLPGTVNPYQYDPSVPANIVFLALFSIITLGHIGLGIKYKTWYFSTVFALGGIGEILGYIGRVGSSFDVMSDPFYTIQLVLLALSPGFFSAGLYLTISNLAVIVGPANSFLKPLYYVVIFSTFDVLALVIQSVGGGSAAVKYHRGESTETATHTLEAGIVLQCFGNIIFTLVAYLLYWRTRLNSLSNGLPTPFPKTTKFKVFVAAILISDAAIIIRAIYRVVELAQGWRGYLLTTELWFYGFDTLPMAVCMAVWLVGHPGVTLGREVANARLRSKTEGNVEAPSPSSD